MLGARPTTYLNELRDRTMHLLAANMMARLNDWKIGNWLIGQGDVRVYYQWMRLEQLDQWHHWFLLLLCFFLLFPDVAREEFLQDVTLSCLWLHVFCS